MSEGSFTESVVEDAALASPESLGYAIKHGPEIAPGGIVRRASRQLLQKIPRLNSNAIFKKCILLSRRRQPFPNGKLFEVCDRRERIAKRLGNYGGLLGC